MSFIQLGNLPESTIGTDLSIYKESITMSPVVDDILIDITLDYLMPSLARNQIQFTHALVYELLFHEKTMCAKGIYAYATTPDVEVSTELLSYDFSFFPDPKLTDYLSGKGIESDKLLATSVLEHLITSIDLVTNINLSSS